MKHLPRGANKRKCKRIAAGIIIQYTCIHRTGLGNILNDSKNSQKVYALVLAYSASMRSNLAVVIITTGSKIALWDT